MSQTAKGLNIDQDRQPTIEILQFFPLQGEWTEEDYFNLPETNHFVELSEGRLIIPDMPGDLHQYVVGELFSILRVFVRQNKLGQVRISPLPVKLWKGKVREPDVLFMSIEHSDRIGEAFWGIPDLAIEVLSKNNVKTDRLDKFSEYAKAGIAEYWIVDPDMQIIEVFVLKDNEYELFGKWGIKDIAHSKLLNGLEIAVEDIMVQR